jgi:hypothetical protein
MNGWMPDCVPHFLLGIGHWSFDIPFPGRAALHLGQPPVSVAALS